MSVCKPCSRYGQCLNCTNSGCTLCKSGLSVVNNVCQPICNSVNGNCSFSCSHPCSSCFGPSSGECLSCSEGVLSGSSCVSNCSIGQYLGSNLTCLKCPYGCSSCDSTACSTCISGFYLSNLTDCVRVCPSGYYPEVSSVSFCDSCSIGCTRCVNSVFCLSCQAQYTLFNFQCSSNQQDYYQWSNGRYKRCPSYCITCKHQVCQRCQSGWILDQGLCVSTCPNNKYSKTINVYNTNNSLSYSHEECHWKDPLC